MRGIKHCGYYGATMNGKTTLARMLARDRFALYSKGHIERKVVVYDPVATETAGGGWPEGALIFTDFSDFQKWVGENGDADLFIDEAGDHFGMRETQVINHWLASRGRHYGYELHLICQRPTMMAPSVRTQLAVNYCFKMSTTDLKDLAADVGHDLPDIEKLDKGEFLVIDSTSLVIAKHNVFTLLNRKPL
jgi:Zonular occludens toxin (Zot)